MTEAKLNKILLAYQIKKNEYKQHKARFTVFLQKCY